MQVVRTCWQVQIIKQLTIILTSLTLARMPNRNLSHQNRVCKNVRLLIRRPSAPNPLPRSGGPRGGRLGALAKASKNKVKVPTSTRDQSQKRTMKILFYKRAKIKREPRRIISGHSAIAVWKYFSGINLSSISPIDRKKRISKILMLTKEQKKYKI